MSELAKILSGAAHYSPHNGTELRAYPKTFRDSLAEFILPDYPNSTTIDAAHKYLGSSGIRSQGISVIDTIPYLGNAIGLQENLQNHNFKGAGLNFLGIIPALGGLHKAIKGAAPSAAIPTASKIVSGAANGLDQLLIQNEPALDDDGY